jgi:Ca2+-binding RTX toxin-like protein
MTELGASGQFSSNDARFYSAPGATSGHDADDRIIFDGSGSLYYDPDGSGPQQSMQIAFTVGHNVTATDLWVINGTTPTPTPTPGQSINGTSGNDTIVGTAGNDTIYANSGNDWVEGRGGNDLVSGGSGQDSYVFREYGAANADTIANFDSNWDALRFDSNAFTALGGPGHFAAGDARFYAAAGATGGHDSDDRLVFDTSSGHLYYDADGSGTGGAQLVATLPAGSALAATDVWVI